MSRSVRLPIRRVGRVRATTWNSPFGGGFRYRFTHPTGLPDCVSRETGTGVNNECEAMMMRYDNMTTKGTKWWRMIRWCCNDFERRGGGGSGSGGVRLGSGSSVPNAGGRPVAAAARRADDGRGSTPREGHRLFRRTHDESGAKKRCRCISAHGRLQLIIAAEAKPRRRIIASDRRIPDSFPGLATFPERPTAKRDDAGNGFVLWVPSQWLTKWAVTSIRARLAAGKEGANGCANSAKVGPFWNGTRFRSAC